MELTHEEKKLLHELLGKHSLQACIDSLRMLYVSLTSSDMVEKLRENCGKTRTMIALCEKLDIEIKNRDEIERALIGLETRIANLDARISSSSVSVPTRPFPWEEAQ